MAPAACTVASDSIEGGGLTAGWRVKSCRMGGRPWPSRSSNRCSRMTPRPAAAGSHSMMRVALAGSAWRYNKSREARVRDVVGGLNGCTVQRGSSDEVNQYAELIVAPQQMWATAIRSERMWPKSLWRARCAAAASSSCHDVLLCITQAPPCCCQRYPHAYLNGTPLESTRLQASQV